MPKPIDQWLRSALASTKVLWTGTPGVIYLDRHPLEEVADPSSSTHITSRSLARTTNPFLLLKVEKKSIPFVYPRPPSIALSQARENQATCIPQGVVEMKTQNEYRTLLLRARRKQTHMYRVRANASPDNPDLTNCWKRWKTNHPSSS